MNYQPRKALMVTVRRYSTTTGYLTMVFIVTLLMIVTQPRGGF